MKMSGVLKVSEAATLALHTMVMFAAKPKELLTTKDIASTLGVSEAHLSKVLQRLAKAGMVKALRGPKGGFCLNRKAEETSLLDVYQTIEGQLQASDCLLRLPVCEDGKCILGSLLRNVNQQVREHLAETRLVDVVGAYGESRNESAKKDR